MYENSTTGGTNGDQMGQAAQMRTEEMGEQLRSARQTAAEALRGRTQAAREWTRSQFGHLQERVEAEPYRATAWALALGFVAGVLITALARGSSRD
ncbi:MAG: hypothetical protein IRZ28_05140 [Steroidobacteraceae bacterium]|nr:hypothetical protein [Steroidobacteraceae bacterium]